MQPYDLMSIEQLADENLHAADAALKDDLQMFWFDDNGALMGAEDEEGEPYEWDTQAGWQPAGRY